MFQLCTCLTENHFLFSFLVFPQIFTFATKRSSRRQRQKPPRNRVRFYQSRSARGFLFSFCTRGSVELNWKQQSAKRENEWKAQGGEPARERESAPERAAAAAVRESGRLNSFLFGLRLQTTHIHTHTQCWWCFYFGELYNTARWAHWAWPGKAKSFCRKLVALVIVRARSLSHAARSMLHGAFHGCKL